MLRKIKDKLKNNKALMISLVAVLIILIGAVSYAAFDYSFTGKDSKLESGSVSIKFLESNTNVIDLKNALPISDSEGKNGDSFDFAVTTKASYKTGLKYDLSVEKLSVDSGYTSLSDNQVKVYLTDNSDSSLLDPTLISSLDSNKIYSKTNKHSSTNTKITDKYKLRVWVDSNVDASNWNQDTKLEYKFKVGLKSEEVETIEYVYSRTSGVSVGDSLNSISNYKTDYTLLNSNIFFKHNLNDNGKISSNEFCIIDNSTLLCLKGGSKEYFEENKKTLFDYYGESSCTISDTNVDCEGIHLFDSGLVGSTSGKNYYVDDDGTTTITLEIPW